jgi:hypothetical protein
VGVLARVLVAATYWPAFWFFDGGRYIQVSRNWAPDTQRPFGYSAFLRLFDWSGSLATVTIFQHVLGLLIATGIYAFLRRRGVSTWLAVLGAAPVALDAYEITIEQYVLAETFFTALLLAGVGLLLWRTKPSLPMVAGAGLAFAAAGLTRTVALPLVAVVVVYLLVRRMGWRRLLLFVAAWTIPMATYMGWYHHYHQTYAFGEYQGRFLYGRVATFVDCGKLKLDTEQRALCPAEPLDNRHSPSFYVWNFSSPQFQHPLPSDDHLFAEFAKNAIIHQPGDYLWMVVSETSGYFNLREYPICTGDWELPNTRKLHCHSKMSGDAGFDTAMASPGYRPPNVLTAIAGSYQHYIYLPGMLWGAAIVVTVCAGVGSWRRRRRQRRDGMSSEDAPGSDGAAPLLVGLGLLMLVLAVATSMFDYRYGVPTLALIPPAGAIAWQQLLRRHTE